MRVAWMRAACSTAGTLSQRSARTSAASARFAGRQLLRQLLEPSAVIHKDFRLHKVLTEDGRVYDGVIVEETAESLTLVPNLLTPKQTQRIPKAAIEFRAESQVSPMPAGLVDVLQQAEIVELLAYLRSLEAVSQP